MLKSSQFKKCIAWIVCHVAKSQRRVVAFGDYLLKLFESLQPPAEASHGEQTALIYAEAALDMLLLLDTIFVRIHENPGRLLRKPLQTYITFAKAIEPITAKFVQMASLTRGLEAIHVHQGLVCILDRWTQDRVFTDRVRIGLRNSAREAYINWLAWLRTSHFVYHEKLIRKVAPEDAQNDFPKTHGLPEDAWYDFPVGVMVPAMKLIRPGHPLKAEHIKPLHMPIGPVDPDMMDAVLDHIEECKNISAVPNIPTNQDRDECILNGIGLRVAQDLVDDNENPKLDVIEGYYGSSVPFMKLFKLFEATHEHSPLGPERPQNWVPPPPPQFIAPPPFSMNFLQNMPPPPNRDVPYTGGGGYRAGDQGRGNGANWRAGENRGGAGGSWRGRRRGGGGGGGGRNWSGNGGYRPY